MKKILILSLVLASLTIVFYQSNISKKNDTVEAKSSSGAYEALNFNGARQTYPYKQIPKGAYSRAWEKLQNSQASRRDGTENTWTDMGPHNRGGRTLAMAFNPQNPNTMYAGDCFCSRRFHDYVYRNGRGL